MASDGAPAGAPSMQPCHQSDSAMSSAEFALYLGSELEALKSRLLSAHCIAMHRQLIVSPPHEPIAKEEEEHVQEKHVNVERDEVETGKVADTTSDEKLLVQASADVPEARKGSKGSNSYT